ncbi:hypothetical protein FA95DRAFT_1256201 [Auriscalpium vulgare]|uniref:Uncharacterized protein n=1 Tax=Auriscalpium vulgare TaxID=40419 RepID=A0ACB8S9Y2_9AGAM|nr:hypothetical protein FA95DRAFT_1256201 [Auriscalpium vulgare]
MQISGSKHGLRLPPHCPPPPCSCRARGAFRIAPAPKVIAYGILRPATRPSYGIYAAASGNSSCRTSSAWLCSSSKGPCAFCFCASKSALDAGDAALAAVAPGADSSCSALLASSCAAAGEVVDSPPTELTVFLSAGSSCGGGRICSSLLNFGCSACAKTS